MNDSRIALPLRSVAHVPSSWTPVAVPLGALIAAIGAYFVALDLIARIA